MDQKQDVFERMHQMANVDIDRGTPDLRWAQPLSGNVGMALSVKFNVPNDVQIQGENAAIAYVEAQLAKACAVAPELSFSVIVGEPDL